jgi:hypothetical protein
MTGAFVIWDLLLQTLARTEHKFLPTLTNSMAEVLTQSGDVAAEVDVAKDAIYQWLTHICFSDEWEEERGRDRERLFESIVTQCIIEPSRWGLQLAREIISRSNDNFRQDWAPAFNAALPPGVEDIEKIEARAQNPINGLVHLNHEELNTKNVMNLPVATRHVDYFLFIASEIIGSEPFFIMPNKSHMQS